MPQIRKKSGRKHFYIQAHEKRRFDDVVETLRYVAYARDKDDLLTAGASKLADELESLADAMAKPVAKRTAEQAVGGQKPLGEQADAAGEPEGNHQATGQSDSAGDGSGGEDLQLTNKPKGKKQKEAAPG